MTDKKKVEETKQAGASYILNFYNEIMLLTHYYSQYINILLELEQKYSVQSVIEKVSSEEKIILVQSVQQIRYSATKAHIQLLTLNTISSKEEKLSEEALKEELIAYHKIRDTFIIKRDDIEEYTQLMNTFLTKNLIKELLETSQQFLKEIYGAAE